MLASAAGLEKRAVSLQARRGDQAASSSPPESPAGASARTLWPRSPSPGGEDPGSPLPALGDGPSQDYPLDPPAPRHPCRDAAAGRRFWGRGGAAAIPTDSFGELLSYILPPAPERAPAEQRHVRWGRETGTLRGPSHPDGASSSGRGSSPSAGEGWEGLARTEPARIGARDLDCLSRKTTAGRERQQNLLWLTNRRAAGVLAAGMWPSLIVASTGAFTRPTGRPLTRARTYIASLGLELVAALFKNKSPALCCSFSSFLARNALRVMVRGRRYPRHLGLCRGALTGGEWDPSPARCGRSCTRRLRRRPGNQHRGTFVTVKRLSVSLWPRRPPPPQCTQGCTDAGAAAEAGQGDAGAASGAAGRRRSEFAAHSQVFSFFFLSPQTMQIRIPQTKLVHYFFIQLSFTFCSSFIQLNPYIKFLPTLAVAREEHPSRTRAHTHSQHHSWGGRRGARPKLPPLSNRRVVMLNESFIKSFQEIPPSPSRPLRQHSTQRG